MTEAVRTTTVARLHHNAWITRDQEATRRFYEDLIGLPLVATWSETDELFGAERVSSSSTRRIRRCSVRRCRQPRSRTSR